MDAYEVREIVDRWTIPLPASPRTPDSAIRPVAARAQGAAIFDADGKRHLDFGSGPAAAILGHNHPRYIDAIKRRLHAVSDGAFLDADALELHRRLGQTLTPPLQKSLLLPHREAATQAAIDIARGVTGGTPILTVSACRHGAVSLALHARVNQLPDKPGAAYVPSSYPSAPAPYPAACLCDAHSVTDNAAPCGHAAGHADEQSLQTSFERALGNCAEKPAALIMEPFIVDEGILVPQGYASMLRKLCHQYGMLFIMDESATGFGKTGRMWAHQHEEIVPDMIIVSERFGAGFSICAVCTVPDIAERASAGSVGSAPWHDPVACAAAVAAIDVVREEKLVARAAAIGGHLRTRLAAMAAANPMIGNIRGRGAMYAIELAAESESDAGGPANARAARAAVHACRGKGLLLRPPCSDKPGNVVHIAPPLVSTPAEIDEGMDILAEVLHDIANVYQLAKPGGTRVGIAA